MNAPIPAKRNVVNTARTWFLPISFRREASRLIYTEHALRGRIKASKYCTLLTGCEFVNQISEDTPQIEYIDEMGELHILESQWLVGADGKTGIVRKYFLEEKAGVKQVEGV